MDNARFAKCLVKTTTSYLAKLKEIYEKNAKAFNDLGGILPERLLPDGERYHRHVLYGTTVEFRYDDVVMDWMTQTVIGLQLLVSFNIQDVDISFTLSTNDSADCIKERIWKVIQHKKMMAQRFIDDASELCDEFLVDTPKDSNICAIIENLKTISLPPPF